MPTQLKRQVIKEETLSVLLVEETINKTSTLKMALTQLQHQLCEHISVDVKLSERCAQYHPDILIINTQAPTAVTLDELMIIDKLAPLPVLIFAKENKQSLIKAAIRAGVSAYIVDDLPAHRLSSLITVALERFNERQLLRNELEQTKTQLANRKIVERAKGYIMEHKSMSEQQAFNSLRKMAMDNGQSLATVAKNVSDVYGLLKQ